MAGKDRGNGRPTVCRDEPVERPNMIEMIPDRRHGAEHLVHRLADALAGAQLAVELGGDLGGFGRHRRHPVRARPAALADPEERRRLRPAIPDALRDRLAAYQQYRSAGLAGWRAGDGQLLTFGALAERIRGNLES